MTIKTRISFKEYCKLLFGLTYKRPMESFYTEIAWKKIFKIDEVTKWFLVYQNNLSAILISKKDMSIEQSLEFKEILRTIQNVPKKLK